MWRKVTCFATHSPVLRNPELTGLPGANQRSRLRSVSLQSAVRCQSFGRSFHFPFQPPCSLSSTFIIHSAKASYESRIPQFLRYSAAKTCHTVITFTACPCRTNILIWFATRSSMHSHQPLEEVNSEDISRSLRVSSSHHTRLHRAHKHPRQSDTDSNSITMPRTVEPEAILEATVHYHALPWEASKPATQPHLYSRPTPRPKASWDNVSSSSASSYAAST